APWVALERVTVAPGARLLEGDDVTVGEPPRRLPVHDLFIRPGIDHRPAEGSRAAAEQPVWRDRLPVGQIRELAVVGKKAQVAADARAAAELPRAGGVADQLEALDDDRLVRLLRLDGDVRGVERPRHRLAPVPRRATAGPREHQLVRDEAASPRAVPAAERRVRHV